MSGGLPIPNGLARTTPHADLLHDLALDVLLQLMQIVGALVGIVQLVHAPNWCALTFVVVTAVEQW